MRPTTPVLVVLLVVLLVAVAGCSGSAPADTTTAPASWSTVFQSSGSGALTTSTFHMSGRPARVSWNFRPPRDGGYFSLSLIPAGKEAGRKIYATHTAPGTGSSQITAPAGDYSIHVVGYARWAIAVEAIQ